MVDVVAPQASLVQLKDTKDIYEENFANILGVMWENIETARFFCSDCKESWAT